MGGGRGASFCSSAQRFFANSISEWSAAPPPPSPPAPSLPPPQRWDAENSSGRTLAHLATVWKRKVECAALGPGSNTRALSGAKPRPRGGLGAGISETPSLLLSPGLPGLPIPPPSLRRSFLLFFLLSEAAVRSGAEAQPGWRGPSKHTTYFVYRGFL